MDVVTNIIIDLKKRCESDNPVMYLDSQYDFNKLLSYLNINKEQCRILCVSNIVSKYIRSEYGVKTETTNNFILNDGTYIIKYDSIEEDILYIVEECNILDLNTFHKFLNTLSKKAKLVLIGDENMASIIESNVFELMSNSVAQKYLEKIELRKQESKQQGIGGEFVFSETEYANQLFDNKDIDFKNVTLSYSNRLHSIENLVYIGENTYTGLVQWGDFRKFIKLSNTYDRLDKYLNSRTLNTSYLKRFIENSDIYFQKTIIMCDKEKMRDVASRGVVVSNFLNIYYSIKIEDVKSKFIELGYPSFNVILDLDLPKLDKEIMLLIEQQFREKYGSWKEHFDTAFFNIVSLNVDIILNQDKNYIFKHTVANLDCNKFLKNEDVVRLAVLKCYNLLNLKKIDREPIKNIHRANNDLNKIKDIEEILKKYNKYDNEVEAIYNISYSILNLSNWEKLNKERTKYNTDEFLISDLNLSITDIETIINFKFSILEIMINKYGLSGIDLVFKGKQESLFFNSLFSAINDYNYQINKDNGYNLYKNLEEYLTKIKDALRSPKDVLHLNEFLNIKKGIKSNIYSKSRKLLECGFMELLAGRDINWRELYEKNIYRKKKY